MHFPPAVAAMSSPCTLVYTEFLSKMKALPHLHYCPSLVSSLKDGTHSLYPQVTLSVPPPEDVSVNIITLDYSDCHYPKTLAPICPPSYPSGIIITPTSSNSTQTRAWIRPYIPVDSMIRPFSQPLALDLQLGPFST